MLTRREVEGELRSLHPFRTSVRNRRAERERARRFAGGVAGVLLGAGLVALLSAVNFLRAEPTDYATGVSSSRAADEWVSSGSSVSRSTSLFFTSRRTWGPRMPGQRHHKSSGDL
jgi:ferric-dicitrate binding protein FerR (iron transport regulator)